MAIKFLRKNMKVIMVALGVPIMIAFLLPSMMGQQGQQDARRAQEYGTYKDAEGQDVIVTTAELASTNTHIEILRDLGAALMGQLIIYPVNPQLTQQLTAAYAQMGISPSTVMATQLIFFGDAQVASIAQSQLSRSIGRLAKTQKDAEQLSKQIGDLIGVDSARGRLYYLLLAEEAHRAGIYATAAQVENFKAICANFGQKSGQIARAKGLSSEQMNSIIATYIAILRHGDAVTRTMAVSEPQLKNIVRDMVESENITGRYVEFSRQRYQDKIAEPTADDLKKHFDTFKSNIPGEVSPDAKDQIPFGFGFVLPDRVKVECLKVNFEDAKNVAIS
ncbi:MAG: hypothetical protein K9M57_09070, partial [Phycisphaerae bacterium]|nr:hypothetical protein [Phycisphaerae bacterium]